MTMPPGASISAASLKKLKGVEDNSSVPMSQDSDIEAREAFKLRRQLFRVEKYADQSEEDKRFNYFKDSLNRKVCDFMLEVGVNLPALADRNEEEFIASSTYPHLGYCSVSLEDLKWMEANAVHPISRHSS